MSNIEIVPMKAEHIPVLAQLKSCAFPSRGAKKVLQKSLTTGQRIFLLLSAMMLSWDI